ncbi:MULTISPECIES: phosphotransferase [unclassified Bradyrhizobium]|uniref:phosphotransferase n=1 Tax=unclassified Bradyrhizobium TaxID=2631580 RepID=UPI002479B901|nr:MULTISPECIES: phosphotransferase [unclassified Bradyrhizobium]WGS18606.1 phosphotransferase [Bradyrhizobium sp. ISRA463]WGS25428.1 phosphotransferase [Bradyrhizobium sp. ISRA464]
MQNSRLSADAVHPLDGLRAAGPIVEARAQTLARDYYGLAAEIRRLDSERDQNFRLRTQDGGEYVLKIANPAEDRAVTNLQTEALRHIADRDPLLPIPRVIPAQDGAVELEIGFDDGSMRVVRLLSFLAGTPMHQAPPSATLRRHVGQCAARLALALRDFVHPGAGHKLLWDIQHAAELRPLLDAVPSAQRHLVERVLNHFEADAMPVLAQLPKQALHNDLNPHNIVVDAASQARVCGIIDFGDLTATARINDLAIAAAYQVTDSEDPLAPALDLVAAYHAVSPLEPRERGILFDLIATRMVMTIVISNIRAARYRENSAYILRNNRQASARLARIATLTRTQATQQIERACQGE